MKQFLTLLFLAAVYFDRITGDTPANCTYEDIRGTWIISESSRSNDRRESCNGSQPVAYTLKIQLLFPNVAVDEYGNAGHWTIIYNQGFEVTINYRKYFAFSYYVQHGMNVTSHCHQTLPGWSHDILGHNWGCWTGVKADNAKIIKSGTTNIGLIGGVETNYVQDEDMIKRINEVQKSWNAKKYSQFEGKSLAYINRLKGGPKSKIIGPPSPAPITNAVRLRAQELPESFDWRNINGQSFVSPVRNQGGCGSCYAFSSVEMIEARLRVITNNTIQVILSPQDVVSCSEYSQGCEGGFPYLIAGKYGQDFGLTPEQCNPYQGIDTTCKEKVCQRWYTARYEYVGGYYGACNDELMRIHLVKNGPLSVSFEVYDDFMSYSGGIYSHTGLRSSRNHGLRFNPFEITNHAVLLVGYGADPTTGEKFWIVKNSWGQDWGEHGYFRIRRGNDECSIESLAAEAFPIP